MKKLFYLPLLFAFVLLPSEATAQIGPFTEKGFGIEGSFSSADNSSTLGVGAGYVFQPAIEAGLGIGRNSTDNADVTTTGIGPYVSVYPVRQDENFPFSIILNGNYSFQTFSGDQIDQIENQGGSVSGNAFGLTAGLFHTFEANESVNIIPFGGVGYTRNKTEISGGGQSISNTEETTSLALSLAFEFETSSSSSFVLTPTARVAENNSSFGISASLVLPSEQNQ
jgi:hypothetical protein